MYPVPKISLSFLFYMLEKNKTISYSNQFNPFSYEFRFS